MKVAVNDGQTDVHSHTVSMLIIEVHLGGKAQRQLEPTERRLSGENEAHW